MTRTARGAWLLAAATFLASPFAPAMSSAASSVTPVRDAAGWLVDRQADDGSFGPADQTADAIVALVVASAPASSIDAALASLEAAGPERARAQAAYAGRIVVALVATGENPRDFGGFDYVEAIAQRYNAVLAGYGGNLFAEALAGLGLLAAGESLPPAYLDRLRAAACEGGGFAYQDRCGRAPDADTTSLAIQVLGAVSRDDVAVRESLSWLQTLQDAEGAFALEAGLQPNANSTGLVVRALDALDANPATFGRGDPVASLREFVTEAGGLSYVRGGKANLLATIQALPALRDPPTPARARPDAGSTRSAPVPVDAESRSRAPEATSEATQQPVSTPSIGDRETVAAPASIDDDGGSGAGWAWLGVALAAGAAGGVGARRWGVGAGKKGGR